MTILDKIVSHKYQEVNSAIERISIQQLERLPLFERATTSLSNQLRTSSSGIIAEFKRRSPSRSVINATSKVNEVASAYEKAGVSGMSVLTDQDFFGGHLADLIEARKSCELPILRKEFIINEYQIIEAKAHGADVILLIAAILTRKQIKTFSELGKSFNLDVLLEIHNEEELHKSLMPTLDMIGVNNRNLKTFEVDLNISKSLSTLIPNEFVKVSESGISSVEAIKELQNYAYQGFLIGENFMKTDDPGKSAEEFIAKLQL